MDSFIYNTRVEVPNDILSTSTQNDSVFLKPSGGISDDAVDNCGGVLQKTQKNRKTYKPKKETSNTLQESNDDWNIQRTHS